jgi:hypothetical protein
LYIILFLKRYRNKIEPIDKKSSIFHAKSWLGIPDLGFRGQKVLDPGSGAATLKKRIVFRRRMSVRGSWWQRKN